LRTASEDSTYRRERRRERPPHVLQAERRGYMVDFVFSPLGF
jgi:hypothetical protein